jgi:hypothetical protein
MSNDHKFHQRLALAFMLFAWAAILGTFAGGCTAGCGDGSGSCIGLPGPDVDPKPLPDPCYVPTECVDVVVAEFCDVEDDEDSDSDEPCEDTHDHDKGKGHREHGKGKGKGHCK